MTEDMNDRLQAKDYQRPEGNQFYDARDGLASVGDIIVMPRFITFVIGENGGAGTPTPSERWFAVGDARVFKAGDRVLVDTVNGKSAVRTIAKVDGRVLILKDRLNSLPKIGGDVFKVVGIKSTVIDTIRSGW